MSGYSKTKMMKKKKKKSMKMMEAVAVISGREITEATLRNFLLLKANEYDTLESNDEIHAVGIQMKVPLVNLQSSTLENLAAHIEAGTVTVRTMKAMGPSDIKSMSGGLASRMVKGKRSSVDRTSVSMNPNVGQTRARKGLGDVGSNPPSSPMGGNSANKTAANYGKGDVGSNPKSKNVKGKNASKYTKAKKGKGDVGANESDINGQIVDMLQRDPRQVAEAADKGYSKAERKPGGPGPRVTKGAVKDAYAGHGKGAGAKDAGRRLGKKTGPSVKGGKTKQTITADSQDDNGNF